MQSTTYWQLLQSEVKVVWTAGQLAQQWVFGLSQMIILWPVIIACFSVSQTVTAWPVSLLGNSVEDFCDKCNIVQCKLV